MLRHDTLHTSGNAQAQHEKAPGEDPSGCVIHVQSPCNDRLLANDLGFSPVPSGFGWLLVSVPGRVGVEAGDGGRRCGRLFAQVFFIDHAFLVDDERHDP